MDVALQELGRAVKRLQTRHHRQLDTAMNAIGTTLAQWDALRAIENSAGASGHVLATLTFQTDQSFGAIVNKLLSQRLVNRHSGAGRALSYTLTDQGQRVLADGSQVTKRVLEASFSKLSAAERDKLYALLVKVLSDDEPARSIRPPRA